MDLYGLIGFPLGHSFSARFFNEKFSREGIDASYRNFELEDIGQLMELLAEIPELKGLNVTIPYKEQILPYLTRTSADAAAIGAVNTVKISHDEEGNVTALEGFNTDAPAFARTLAPLLPLEAVSALVLGTGGASKAVSHALSALGISHQFVSRTPEEGELSYDELTAEIMAAHRLIINTTPLGMSPKTDACPPIPYEFLSSDHICYELIYNPETTLFMAKSAQEGATVKNGLDMLHLQALLAWKIWH
ncbi:MAG: shikimate dehydrogenase [Bacteroides sp.]|nr:shikimate dehydrogenase [Bacteroides sp.]MBD5372672.1 shikimate dehydrogenase [Bacteroides sp.]